ncbi:ABC transporter permease [Aquimarina algiphila]|uniref:ABC transporter permease n=2 Tax=Aquimarina algiphila TaxID=2047982 RepID=UPI0024900A71|nr:ABC transporter permease [Aquimarina algiphila]
MFIQRLRLFFRQIKKSKLTFFINLVGMISGLTCVLFIYLWVSDELNVDKFHEKDGQLVQIMQKQIDTDQKIVYPNQSAYLADALKEDIPEVEMAVRTINGLYKNTLSNADIALKAEGLYADHGFFDMFSFSLIQGIEKEALEGTNNMVISRDLATSLFGSVDNSIGKSISFNKDETFKVSAVFENITSASTLQFDFVLPFDVLFRHYPYLYKDWNYNYARTFVLLTPETTLQQLNTKIEKYLTTRIEDSTNLLLARPFSEGYLYGKYEDGVQTGGRIDYVRLFFVIGFFILFIACINFMNLSTAHASLRTKEIGLRKALGGKRKSLVFQFLWESTFLVSIALIVSIVLVIVLLPFFNELTNKTMVFRMTKEMVLFLIGVNLVTGLVAGMYPAFYISGFNIVQALTGKLKTTFSEFWVRKGLVVFQFSISVILIIGVLIIYKQISLMQNTNQGFDRENIVYFSLEGTLENNPKTFLEEVKNLAGVKNASIANSGFFGGHGGTSGITWEGKNEEDNTQMSYLVTDYDMIELMGMEILEGRSFSRDFGSDSTKIIFNEAAIKKMGLKDPIGAKITLWDTPMEIVGVVKNFHFESLQEELKPIFMYMQPQRLNTVMLKLEKGDLAKTIDELTRFYEKYNPGFPLEYKFLDADFQKLYKAERMVLSLSKYFAGLAIIISCLGLFGLAIFTAQRRRKEISIRKVLGQSTSQVTMMLSGEFAKLVLIAISIALPVAYLLASDWLSGFAYKIPLKIWYFFVAGFVALLVAMLTVGAQAIGAANKNPIDGLRDE